MFEEKKLTVDLYIRVSTEKQASQGDSLEEQESELKKYCEFRGFKIHRVYVEKGRSAKNTDRPEYQKMLKDITSKKIDAIVIKKLDRLSRSLLDFEQLLLTLQTHGVAFISLKEQFDTSNAMGQAMIKITMVFAELERRQISERVSDTMGYRASQGLFNGGLPPYGYTNANKELIPYPKERQIIEIAFEEFLKNKSTTETSRFLNMAGFQARDNKPFDCRFINKILQNPVYVGKVRWKSKVYQGIHQPIITDRTFDMVQTIFENRKYLKQKHNHKYLLQGMVTCGECGCPMTPSYALNWKKDKYFYYRCTSTNQAHKGGTKCTYKYTPKKALEKQFVDILISLSSDCRLKPIESKIAKHNQNIERIVKSLEELTSGLSDQLTLLKNKKERYLDSLIEGKFLSKERDLINNQISELELEEKQLKSQIFKQDFECQQQKELIINLSDFKQDMVAFKLDHSHLTITELRAVISNIIKDITYHPNKLVLHFRRLDWAEEFQINKT